MPSETLNELRLLSSAYFDSENLLTTLLCGDETLPERFRSKKLLALGSRTRTRHRLEPYDRELLLEFIDQLLVNAGNPALVTESLRDIMVDHCGGNLRILVGIGAELFNRIPKRRKRRTAAQKVS